jgi:hypothetical protein
MAERLMVTSPLPLSPSPPGKAVPAPMAATFTSKTRQAIDFLSSGRLAVWTLAVLILLLLLYLLIPQANAWEPERIRQWAGEAGLLGGLCLALGLTDVQRSWWLVGTYVILFVNLAFCMTRRFVPMLATIRFPDRPPRAYANWRSLEIPNPDHEPGSIAPLLRKKGYRTLVTEDRVYGLRGRFAPIGSWVFHVSLLALLAAGAFVAASPDPFRGTAGIGQGEPFDLHSSPLLSANAPPSSELPALSFQLEGIDAVTDGEEVREFEGRLRQSDGRLEPFGINRPYRSRPYQVMAHGFGYMPGWAIVDQRGGMRMGAWVKLVPFPLSVEESFQIGHETSKVHVRLHPDHELAGRRHRSRTYELNNPRFETRIVLRGEEIYKGLLEPGERVPLENGREFFFLPEIRKYALVDILEEEGHEIIFSSFGTMILGLFLRYARLRKEILVHLGNDTLTLYGRSEILENLFGEEMDRLAGELSVLRSEPAGGKSSP